MNVFNVDKWRPPHSQPLSPVKEGEKIGEEDNDKKKKREREEILKRRINERRAASVNKNKIDKEAGSEEAALDDGKGSSIDIKV